MEKQKGRVKGGISRQDREGKVEESLREKPGEELDRMVTQEEG